ncbi:MAG: mucoidy inhibitor MuiA family protein [Lewinellaceae bacterium]|nr:mucoidy inhibitor MuiA family protein [Lewinellaceae bacterium]
MKKTVLLLLSLAICSLLSAQETQKVTSNIEKVTVFLRGAQVNRTAKTSLKTGKTELVFKDISPNIDKTSIQVKGDGVFTILSVVHQLNRLEEQKRRDEILQLEAQKRRQQEARQLQNAHLSVCRQEKAMLEKNQSIGGANNGVSTAELRQAVDFQRQRMTEVLLQEIEKNNAIAVIDSVLGKIELQLKALNQQKELSTSEIHVTVSAAAATSAGFDITYYVKDAGWFANYDLRVKDVSSPIDLSFKANVYQSSGEDWKNVQLTLSSGDPTLSGFAPELEPWMLRFGYQQQVQRYNSQGRGGITQVSGIVTDQGSGEPLIGATVILQGTTIGTFTDLNGRYVLNIPPTPAALEVLYTGYTSSVVPVNTPTLNIALGGNMMLNEVVVTGMRAQRPNMLGSAKKESRADKSIPMKNEESYQPTTVSFAIELPYTILNDGKSYVVDIKSETVPAEYEYFAAPKLDENAYLTAYITDWQDLNLLDGEVNLFFEGAYLGKSLLDTRNAGDTLDISLGQDKNIVVKRTKLKEFSVRQFIGANKTDTRAFEISVRNNKQQPIRITVQDQFPISTNKDISVEDLRYEGAELDPKTQILSWKLDIAPREERKFGLRYSVKYPKREVLVLE